MLKGSDSGKNKKVELVESVISKLYTEHVYRYSSYNMYSKN